MEQFAIIRNSHIAYEDHHNKSMWWFDVEMVHRSSLQIQSIQELLMALDQLDLPRKAESINGRVCRVIEKDNLIHYIGVVV